MEFRLFNVKFAPNLGDGLLSECLEEAIQKDGDHACTSADLAARKDRDTNGVVRINRLRLLTNLPPSLRPYISRLPMMVFKHIKWTPHYRKSVKGVDAVVIGGGNLITDLDLNFPIKIRAVFKQAKKGNLPVAIYGCGVSDEWSSKGLKLIRKALSQGKVVKVALRDAVSKKNWDKYFGTYTNVQSEIVWDPAILSSRFKPSAASSNDNKSIGIEITGFLALRYHSDFSYGELELKNWYLSVISEVIKADFKPVIFTNGTPEDLYFLDSFRSEIENLFGDKVQLIQPKTPDELCLLLSNLKGLIAHRLHAIIPTYSYGVPVLALKWDPKLTSFLDRIHQSHRVIGAVEFPPEKIVAKLFDNSQDVDSVIGEKQEEALMQVKDLIKKLERAVLDGKKNQENFQRKATVYINGRFLTQPVTGVQRFAQEIVLGLDKILSTQKLPIDVVLAVPRKTVPRFSLKNIQVRAVGLGSGHIWEQLALFWATRHSLLINLGSSGSVLKRKQLTVIHDAAVHRIPENYSFLYAFSHRCLDHMLALRSRIATVSEFSRRELSQILRMDSEAIEVFANGYEHILNIVPDNAVLDRLNLHGRRYFLFVGSPTPNKNLGRAIEAFRMVHQQDTTFVIVGVAEKFIYQSTVDAYSENVIHTGRLTDEEIAALYCKATALVFPSLYEGFGIPPLEAMAHGCPVIASRIAVIEEVCGDAVLYVDPLNATDLAARINEILTSPELRKQLIERGSRKIKSYSWEKTAGKLLDLIKKETETKSI